MKKRFSIYALLVIAALACALVFTVSAAADNSGSAPDFDFTPKTSITLGSELVYNIYVPAAEYLESFTVDGETCENAELVTLENGEDYYRVPVTLPAREAARDVILAATLTEGGKDYEATWTMSIPKYAKRVVESNAVDEEITLVRDVLSYIRAAYAYFDCIDAEKIAMIDEILGANYDESNAPALDGSKDVPTVGLKGAAYVLDAKPAIRFYITADASSYAFYVNGARLETVSGADENGAYLEASVYAYKMGETVDYTVNGEAAGSYHINSYHNFVSTDDKYKNNDELINLVSRFAKYCESASAYREKFLAMLDCEHKFSEGECTECGKPDPTYVGTMTMTLPAEIYSNYPGKDVEITFSKPDYKGKVTYTTDNANVFVEDGKIFAKGTFSSAVNVTVTAKTPDHTATATVKVLTYDGNISVEKKVQYYESNIIKEENKGGMIFVGDSYFDGYTIEEPPFWKDFYQDYAGEKAFLMGLSSSQIHQLEIASERIVYPMEPSEIVVHIGHNDMHHGNLTVEQFVERLTALFEEYHRRLPDATIYYCGVDPKKIAEDISQNRYESSFVKAPAVNEAVKALDAKNDWIVFVDTSSIFYAYEENTINKNMYPSSDASHPSLIAYDVMRLLIDKARGKTQDDVIYINNLDNAIGVNAAGKTFTDKEGKPLTHDFAMSGKLAITKVYKSNAHLQFRFDNSPDCRFVLWDQNSDGKFGAGHIFNGSSSDKTSGITQYDANDGLTLNWTVILKDNKAYWFINGKLMKTFDNPSLEYFNIGAQRMNAVLFDIELDIRKDDETAFLEHITPYFDENAVNIKMYGNNGDANATGKTLTDKSGNALTDNYIVRGKLNIEEIGRDNAYLQLRLGQGYRFLLWDSNKDGKVGAGYTENNVHTNDTASGIKVFDAREGLELDWAVVVKNGKAYWYLNGELIKKFASPKLESFIIGAVQMDVLFSDIEVYAKSDDETAYNREVSKYITDGFNINMYGNNTDITGNGKFLTDEKGNNLVNNFIVSGSLKTSAINYSNPHLQFRFSDTDRFLLWDSDNNKLFGAAYEENNSHVNDTSSNVKVHYDATNGLELEWAVVVHDGKAYWYVNGELVKTFENPKLDKFNIGALQMDVAFSDVSIVAKSDGADLYYAELTKYFDNTLFIQKYGQDGDVVASGRTYTEINGKPLTGNYIVRGTLDVTSVNKSNAHLQFRTGSGCRFLLWDSSSDGVFGAGYMFGSQASDKTSGVTLYDANNGLTLDWAVVVNGNKAYWYLNGKLEQTLTSPKLESFNIGALQMNVFISDIEFYVEADNASAYNSVLSEYLK